jgi:hypothetical protein
VLYRAPGSSSWEPKDWDFAIKRIATLVKKERDAAFITQNVKGQTVNRCETMSFMGSSNILSEECWVAAQWARGVGLTYIDHQARV